MASAKTEFLHTAKALCQLENHLNCCICHKFTRSPVTLGGCEHLFCNACCEPYLGGCCPVCDIPGHVKDAEVDRQLHNLANLCYRLRKVLSPPGNQKSHQQSTGNDELTVAQQSTPVPESITGQDDDVACSNENSASKQETPQDASSEKTTKKNNRRSGRRSQANKTLEDEEAMDTKVKENDPKISDPEAEGRKKDGAKTSIKSRKAPPGKAKATSKKAKTKTNSVELDQSTMTQFFDQDEGSDDGNTSSTIPDSSKKSILDSDSSKKSTLGSASSKKSIRGSDSSKKRGIDGSSASLIQTTMTQFNDYEDDDQGEGNVESESVPDENPKRGARSHKRKSQGETGSRKRTRLRHSLGGHEAGSALMAMSEPDIAISADRATCQSNKPTENLDSSVRTETPSSGSKRKRASRKSTGSAGISDSPLVDQTSKTDTSKKTTQRKSVSDASGVDQSERKCAQKDKKAVGSKVAKKTVASPATNKVTKGRVASPATSKVAKERVASPVISKVGKGRVASPAPSKLAKDKAPAPTIDKRNAKGETALQVAAIKNDVGKVRELLSAGGNPNVRDNAGWTPLHEACNHGYLEVAGLLLDGGAMINVPGLENDTALHDAISNNRLDCVKLLVSRGASLTIRNMHGKTALDLAVTDVMKEALKTPVVSPAISVDTQPLDVLEYQPPCLLGTGLSREAKVTLQKAATRLKVKLADEVTPEVTHIVTRGNEEGMCPRTIKLLIGVLMGKWIVNMEWLATCSEVGSLVCEEAFEVQGTSLSPNSRAPNKGRINRKHQLPGLFNGCQFYFHGYFEYAEPSKEELVSLLKAGDGQILSREPKPGHLDDVAMTVPYHSDPGSEIGSCCVYVVHENNVKFEPIRMKQMCSVPVSWIMDCASNFALMPLQQK